MTLLDYCLVWGTCNAGSKERILKLQKSAARIILNASYFERSTLLFEELGWKTFDRHVKQKRMIGLMMYKIINDVTPCYLKELFIPITDIHTHEPLSSRSSMNFYISGGHTEYHRNRFNYLAAKEWNELNINTKHANTLLRFKDLIFNVI